MTNISPEKNRLLKIYAKKYCGLDDFSQCNKSCSCSVAAEFRAILNSTIPDGYRAFSIRDFHGKIDNDYRLDTLSAINAKKKIFEYCWGDIKLMDKLSILKDEELDKSSKIANRIDNGNHVVIYGNSSRDVVREDEVNVITERPLGRTFMASILTREAIKLKLQPAYRNLNYEWVEFSTLLQSIKSDENEAVHYESCDWLVVDDITSIMLGASIAQKAYLQPLIDSFFQHRYKNKLPTILIFKFDIMAHSTEIESSFGVSVNKIINDKKTFLINLKDSVKEKSGS